MLQGVAICCSSCYSRADFKDYLSKVCRIWLIDEISQKSDVESLKIVNLVVS